MNIRELLERHEGRRNKLYKDSVGLWTIGVGHLIDPSRGGKISDNAVNFILDEDIAAAVESLEIYPWVTNLSEPRKAAMIDLVFNLGAGGLAKFVKFLTAMSKGDWQDAANELVNSSWYDQVGRRGHEIVELIKNETWPI